MPSPKRDLPACDQHPGDGNETPYDLGDIWDAAEEGGNDQRRDGHQIEQDGSCSRAPYRNTDLPEHIGKNRSDQGEAMVERAEAVEEAMANLTSEAEGQSDITGLVRLASVESLVTPLIVPALAPLLARHTGLDVEILFSTATVNMNRRDADLALRMVPPEQGNLRVRHLATLGFGLYGPPQDHLEDKRESRRHIVWPESGALNIILGWSAAFRQKGEATLAVNTLAGQVQAVAAGIGISVLPHFLARPVNLHLITGRTPDGSIMERKIYLVSHADLARSRRIQAVAECLATAISQRRRELSGTADPDKV